MDVADLRRRWSARRDPVIDFLQFHHPLSGAEHSISRHRGLTGRGR
jgi:hypothetical protein